MSQRREIETRLALYDDLTGILGAMRSFALAELRRIGKREENQQLLVQNLRTALNDVAFALPPPEQPDYDIWLLFGSVRGFCGSFNEDVLRLWQEQTGERTPAILIGERLHDLLPESANDLRVPGANGGLDAAATIEAILPAIAESRQKHRGTAGLVACFHDDRGASSQRLLPLTEAQPDVSGFPPHVYASPEETAAGIAEHYLFHQILAILLRSIRVENHMRLMQMENALHHLEEGSSGLIRQRNRLRQEEIVEEIELMVSGKSISL
ncbi:F0F1 ATP synthase subunit gamma [Methylomicrobium sp. RS1]|jgi:F-type H+-transporting ATPase subunit gamma|uniref:F0F1 ATP synthase subunit gamma n=1 Tax=Candidatus Methylomicrobium oryzae TaxID=2802053 RepID=UPI0019241CE6|nr:FoF1 ATP synthase subunit gamma [Methylomicrobium sp. RS1]MBL1262791.1 F0F1 ATP synthase subunit gamma [Methylomicrobium sp. RS1]